MQIPIGVANSVSANFSYDNLDTIKYSQQANFELLQIYVDNQLLENQPQLKKLRKKILDIGFNPIYIHCEGFLNKEFHLSKYKERLFEFAHRLINYKLILHFDELTSLEIMLEIISAFSRTNGILYLENYFQSEGRVNAEKNIRKYLAVFTLANNQRQCLAPVIDIPRFFNNRLDFGLNNALQWCFEMLNFFANKKIPILLHLIDAKLPSQDRSSFCAIGEGYIPYKKLFDFIKKTKPPIEGIIMEYEDKISPLRSRDNIIEFLSG